MFELLKTQEISHEMHIELIKYCKKRKIMFLSTPYGEKSADLLEELGIPAFKIASTDTNNISLIKYIARFGKPVILSSGMASLLEISKAVDILCNSGLTKDLITILHCNTEYPTPI